MISGLFLSQNQKLVKKWTKEHEQIVLLATNVIGEYSKNNKISAKKYLVKLNDLAVDHLMNEDIEFYRLLKDQKRLTPENEKEIKEFTETFKGTKMTLMGFLTKYTREDAILNDTFFKVFNELVDVLVKRIEFEESNLYTLLYAKG